MAQTIPEQIVLIGFTFRVFVDNFLGFVTSHLNELPVTRNVCNLQIEGHAALLGALKIARTAQLQIGLGNTEAVVGVAHDVDALAGVLTEFVGGDEYAVALVGTTTNTPSELV